jgi:hypothetical protein
MKKSFDGEKVLRELNVLMKERNACRVGTKKYLKVNSRIQSLKARLRKNGFHVPSNTADLFKQTKMPIAKAVDTPHLKDMIFDKLVDKLASEFSHESIVQAVLEKIKKQA